MNTKKIFFISHWYPSTKILSAGIFIKKHAYAISSTAEVNIIHFDIQHSNDFLSIKLLKDKNEEILTYKIQVYSRFYKFLYFLIPFQFFLLKKLIKKFDIEIKKFDIIHSNVIFPNGMIGMKISKKYNIPQVHTEHWSGLSSFLTKNILKNQGLKVFENCKYVISVSEFLKKELLNYLPENKIIIIPNVVDSNIFNFKEKIIDNSKIRFLSIAYWKKPKNPFYFLDALEILSKNKNFNFELNLVGLGPQIKEIKSKNYSFKINYLGLKNSNELVNYFQKSNFLLHGSDYETFSVVIIESLYTGTPVLVNNVGVASEVINKTNGIICSNDVQDWKIKIHQAIHLKYNYKQISEDIINGKYESKKIGQQFLKIYEKIKYT